MNAVIAHTRPRLTVAASSIEVGDEIIQPECIPLLVTSVRGPLSGWMIVGYECTAGLGKRSMVAGTLVNVTRAAPEAGH